MSEELISSCVGGDVGDAHRSPERLGGRTLQRRITQKR